ncbi:Ras GTPase [Chytriomyces hyalinus]|nr:Ras GTPase [Chytriomyces hyalinus]
MVSSTSGTYTSFGRSVAADEFKVVVLGSAGVGKSAFTSQFMKQQFIEVYEPTIEDSFKKFCIMDGENCMLDVLDTAGKKEYVGLRDKHIANGEVFLIIYSTTNRTSFEEASALYRQINRIKQTRQSDGYLGSIPIVLIANQCDAPDSVVTSDEGLELAREFQCPFVEASAKLDVNVQDAFTLLVREAKRYRKYVQERSLRLAAEATREKERRALHSRSSSSGSCCVM